MFEVLHNDLLFAGLDKSFRLVDKLEVLVEGLGLARGGLLEVDVGAIAENLREEVVALLVVEQVVLRMVAHFTVLVNPLEEEILVCIEVWLLHEQGPKAVDVFNAQGYIMI